LEMKGKLDDDAEDDALSGPTLLGEEEEEVPERPEKPAIFEMPHPRFNAQLAVQDDVLYIFGGTFEKGDQEFTFDEMWAIDLGKMDGAKEIFRREVQDWQGSDDEESEDEDEDDEMEDEDDEGEAVVKDTEMKDAPPEESPTPAAERPETAVDEFEEPDEPTAMKDDRPHPRPFESLREFFARSKIQWEELVLDELARTYGGGGKAIKEIRKIAFERSEAKWWDCREEITALEDEQMEAGIGEVVSIADKGGAASGGVGRRR
ncbi:hypothetical protein LTS18_011299, partial [Coniosporium uncinatum]